VSPGHGRGCCSLEGVDVGRGKVSAGSWGVPSLEGVGVWKVSVSGSDRLAVFQSTNAKSISFQALSLSHSLISTCY
jgi:hypothetical protein